MKPYDIVAELEKQVAEYCGANHAIAVDSCSNALLLAIRYRLDTGYTTHGYISIPRYTYVGVAQAILNAGGKIVFRDENWQGAYELVYAGIIDAARRFRRKMCIDFPHDYFTCTSGHWGKHLKIGRGGFILLNDADAAETLRRMRYDGRRAGVRPADDDFIRGYHCYPLPEEAARALMLMSYMPDFNEDIPWDDYTDLSKYKIFGGKV